MTTRFTTLKVESADGGANVTALRSAALYLDTSDLSCLLLGRLNKDTVRPPQWRARIEALLRADKVRLRISPIHFAELALRRELYAHALQALAGVPNVYLVSCRNDSVFRAELEGEQVVLEERPLTATDLAQMDFGTRFGPVNASGARVARFVKGIARLEASARNLAKRARKHDATDAKAKKLLGLQVLRGETDVFPKWSRPAVAAFARLAPRVLHRLGSSLAEVERALEEESRGFAWTATIAPGARLPRKDGKKWKPEAVLSMPATVLRASVERVHADPNRPADDGTHYDVEHLAFVAYSDFGTVDGANFDALKPVLRQLSHLHVFKTGNLDPLLEVLENTEMADSEGRA
jgi:hypothetical protein